jgi:FkbM family methyltransferase
MPHTVAAYREMYLTWTLDTGIELTIENTWDWIVFCDMFVNREYPFSVMKGNRKAQVLDLGANVGYFSLLVAHECKKAGIQAHVTAVEGNPDTFAILESRTRQCADVIVPVEALVGKREGLGYITLSHNHGTSAVVGSNSTFPHVPMSYVDLNTLVPEGLIDCIKCDIEGSEFDLVANYPDLLVRTGLVFMEVHNAAGNAAGLYKQMASYGFKREMLLNHETATTEVFYQGWT